VRELLTSTGQLQAPATESAMRRRVAKLLNILGLTRQVRGSMTAISLEGSQRRGGGGWNKKNDVQPHGFPLIIAIATHRPTCDQRI
jgi:hypothetical protein